VPTLKHSNVIATYITAGGRIYLYSYLDSLRDKALFCQTDSVVYIQPRNEPGLVETGDCLGATTSDLKPDELIFEFIAVGRKNYAYKTLCSTTCEHKTICKVRSITLNYNASQIMNFTILKR
jgi:hypothetical protein